MTFDLVVSTLSPVHYIGDKLVFNATLAGESIDSTNFRSVWMYEDGALELIMRESEVPPGATSAPSRPTVFALNSSGQIGIGAAFNTDSNIRAGTWLLEEGDLTPIAISGEHAPGTASEVNFLGIGISNLNSNGHIAMRASIIGPDISIGFNGVGLWTNRSGTLELFVRAGEPPIGVTDDSSYIEIGGFAFNAHSKIAYEARLYGPDINHSNDRGIWSEGNGDELMLIARDGDPAPGATSDAMGDPDEYRYDQVGHVQLTDTGITVFDGQIVGPGIDDSNDEAIWWAEGDTVNLLAQEGMQAPGVEGVGKFYNMGFPQVNALGQIAFTSELVGEQMSRFNDTGIWATDINGNLQLVVKTGDQIEITPGEFRAISSITSLTIHNANNGDGRSRWFNERGQIVFVATLRGGGSGIFVTDAVAIPEPASCVLLAVGALLLLSRARTTQRFSRTL